MFARPFSAHLQEVIVPPSVWRVVGRVVVDLEAGRSRPPARLAPADIPHLVPVVLPTEIVLQGCGRGVGWRAFLGGRAGGAYVRQTASPGGERKVEGGSKGERRADRPSDQSAPSSRQAVAAGGRSGGHKCMS
jgi:hypothetical protein